MALQFTSNGQIIRRINSEETIYKGFDLVGNKEIEWRETQLPMEVNREFLATVERISREGCLMKNLNHVNIVKCLDYYVDTEKFTMNLITEHFSSGNLIEFLSNHESEFQGYTAVKKWSRQILNAIEYLHNRELPSIIHNHIRCESIFVDGKTGNVKLGDFGDASFVKQGHCRSSKMKAGDIKSFGMCVLQMMTRDFHQSDPVDAEVLRKVKDPAAVDFITKCLRAASDRHRHRHSATQLLRHPFVAPEFPSTESPSLTGIHRWLSRGFGWGISAISIPLFLKELWQKSTDASSDKQEVEGGIDTVEEDLGEGSVSH